MPKLTDDVWIQDGFYIDFDPLDQLRIIGPNNHLYCGLLDIPRHKIEILDTESVSDKTLDAALIKGKFTTSQINLYYPAMDDIRTIREITWDSQGNKRSFLKMRREDPKRAESMAAFYEEDDKSKQLTFKRFYDKYWYGVTFIFSKSTAIKKIEKPYVGYFISDDQGEINFSIKAATNDLNAKNPTPYTLTTNLDFSAFNHQEEKIKYFWERTKLEIEHLINWSKTSGVQFGTVFPRDWLESLLLGAEGDIPEDAATYMLKKTLVHVNEKGEGWHEDVVGEFKYEFELAGREIVDRKMIDVEPLYLLALPFVSNSIWKDAESAEKLKRVAQYILKEASEKEFITFKELPPESQSEEQKYHTVGNWRDSDQAYKGVHQLIAPFDVNAVFYPIALKNIAHYYKQLSVDKAEVKELIEKWQDIKSLYNFTNKDGRAAYCLALYDTKSKKEFRKFTLNHLDESYLYFLDDNISEEHIKSFGERLMDPDYFYTPSGPLIVSNNNSFGYTSADYHGLVIWTKQVAFAIAALTKQLQINPDWNKETREVVKKAALKMSRAIIRTFCSLDAIPELHIDEEGKPAFYKGASGLGFAMNKVQLWSAVGARRIFRDYARLIEM